MQNQTKSEIKASLAIYISRFKSQNQAVNSLSGISGSYVSQIMNEKWEAISDEMWRNVSQQIGYVNSNWVFTETSISVRIIQSFNLARSGTVNNITPILARGGSGKTMTAIKFAKDNRGVLYINCNRKLSLKNFLKGLLNAAGKNTEGLTTEAIGEMLIGVIRKIDNPIIIIDEANKASDNILLEIVDLYNSLKYKCPIILLATQEFKLRIERGVNKKMGYDELFSRFNRHFIDLKEPDYNDVAKVCIANGMSDNEAISRIAKSSLCDLRAVEDKIKIEFTKQNKAA